MQLYTDLKEALAREQQAKRHTEDLDRAKNEWITLLSHELRTPLTPIVGWASLLREKADPEEIKRAADVIDRNVKEHARVIDDLIDASQIVAWNLRFLQYTFDFALAVTAALAELNAAARAHALRISRYLENCLVKGDRQRLQQVVRIVLHNAIKFTPHGGAIDLTLREVRDRAELTIRDTGLGIDPEVLRRIFDRFQPGDASTKRRVGGLGLGLWIANYIVCPASITFSRSGVLIVADQSCMPTAELSVPTAKVKVSVPQYASRCRWRK